VVVVVVVVAAGFAAGVAGVVAPVCAEAKVAVAMSSEAMRAVFMWVAFGEGCEGLH
jgi:hypothetical protein